MRRRRGNLPLIVVVTLAAASFSVLSILSLTANVRSMQFRQERQYKAELASNAIVAHAQYLAANGLLTLPRDWNLTVGGITASARAEQDAAEPKGVRITTTVPIESGSYRRQVLVGDRRLRSPFRFGLYVAEDLDFRANLTVGTVGVPADVFVSGKLRMRGSTNYVYGTIETSDRVTTDVGVVTTKGVYENSGSIPFPLVNPTDYLTRSNDTRLVATTFSGVAFPGVAAPYRLIYVTGNATLRGNITGRGVIYVTGNLTIDGNVNYVFTSAKLVCIVAGDLTVASDVTNVSGIYRVRGTYTREGSSSLTLSPGALVAQRINNANNPFTIARDTFFDSDTNCRDLLLPGFWP